jgi:hypothetical protein
MQTFHRAGLARQRDAIGAELVELAGQQGLDTYQLLGHLIRMQARSGLGDFDSADAHALAADTLAEQYGSPLVSVFTTWYRALRTTVIDSDPSTATAAYQAAAATLDGAGMPGLQQGLVPLTRLATTIRDNRPAPTDEDIDWGPYEPWARPLVLIARGQRTQATTYLHTVPDPPHGHLQEALWCLHARAAVVLHDHHAIQRSLTALTPAADELAGAASGLITLGPVANHLHELTEALTSKTKTCFIVR